MRRLGPAALLLLVALASAAHGQEVAARYTPEVEREARRLFSEILSPYCPGLTLTACPSEGAFILKDSIRAELAAGRTRAQVMAGLEARFGAGIHARPPARGIGLVAWVAPFAALALAGGLLTWWLARARRRRAAPPRQAPPLDPADQARLDAALRADV